MLYFSNLFTLWCECMARQGKVWFKQLATSLTLRSHFLFLENLTTCPTYTYMITIKHIINTFVKFIVQFGWEEILYFIQLCCGRGCHLVSYLPKLYTTGVWLCFPCPFQSRYLRPVHEPMYCAERAYKIAAQPFHELSIHTK